MFTRLKTSLLSRFQADPPLDKFRLEFKKKFPNSHIVPENIFDLDKIEIGEFSYGSLNVMMWINPDISLKIGTCVSIAAGVVFILEGNHRYDTISTYPVNVEADLWQINKDNPEHMASTNGPVIVLDD